ncbi:MAG: DUF2339 domain-containing protein [Planctomycetota bacterium]|jgi:uncharacterized membrane protein
MECFFGFIIIAAGLCFICGPIALIIALNARNRVTDLEFKLRYQKTPFEPVPEKPLIKPPEAPQEPLPAAQQPPPVPEPRPPEPEPTVIPPAKTPAFFKEPVPFKLESLEQKIGTKWILIAGIITVIVGVGYFLKYAYDTNLIGPLGRVVIAAIAGLVAMVVGEVTRRRGFGIVAKGVTALGFVILYLAVFSAYRWYHLIDSIPAFIIAILITTASMLYAVSLNEILMAILSLIGGFLTPIIVSTGENLPIPLFTYVVILGTGAMLCSYYCKWRAVNLVAFLGTYLLYTGWFEKFYRHAMRTSDTIPEQMPIALIWLGIFFTVFLVLPILYELVKKLEAKKEDVLLILANAAVVFYYLWTILYDDFRIYLAFCAVGLCAAHLFLMTLVLRRCKEDISLRLALLAIGLFFLTIAIPLALSMYAIALAWAVEAVVLSFIAFKYRSLWTHLAAAVAMVLAISKLFTLLPLHSGAFVVVLNPHFASWCFVAAALLIAHFLYRRDKDFVPEIRDAVSQVLYVIPVLLFLVASIMECYWHCDYNILERGFDDQTFIRGIILIFTVFPLFFLIRPLSPPGPLCPVTATLLAAGGSLFIVIAFTEIYKSSFTVFANINFLLAIVFVTSLFLSAYLIKKLTLGEPTNLLLSFIVLFIAIFVLWILLTEQIYLYWYCRNRYAGPVKNFRFLANMYISVMWAIYGAVLMTAGFIKKAKILRYLALALFALLLLKVFIIDTSTVKSVYRIAAFLATGVTLVAVSYLYQYVKKKGFFEAMLSDKTEE